MRYNRRTLNENYSWYKSLYNDLDEAKKSIHSGNFNNARIKFEEAQKIIQKVVEYVDTAAAEL